MFNFFANIFGYLLQFVYFLVDNYGLAIILFTIVIRAILLPLSIKQQKSMKKSNEINEKMKILQFKYKNDPEKLNQEIMELYKNEKMNPFSGCITAIVQLILLLSIFYLVRNPLTYMEKIPAENINNYIQQLKDDGKTINQVYPEIDLIREYQTLKEKNPDDPNVDKINIDMNFIGLDLSKIPQQNMDDYKVYIIPILYIISSFISIRMTNSMQQKQKEENETKEINESNENEKIENDNKDILIDGKTGEEIEEEAEKDENEVDAVMQTNKMMSWMMPLMSVSIAFVAPLGLALYWLVSNIIMIIERIILDKIVK